MSSYSVIIPALNEEAGIASVIERLLALSPAPEVVVVDDGSTDKTGDIARAKGAKVLRHPMPGGYGRSLKDGMRAASHDIVAIADADGTYPLERIPELVKRVESGFDMSVGARQGRHYRGSFFKMPARLVFKWLVEFTTGRRIPDINSGLRAFRKSEVLKYEDDLCNGFSFTTTITLIYMLTGKFVDYVAVDYAKRIGRSKVRFVRDSLRTLQYITEVIATYNPLKLYTLLCGVLGLITLLLLVGWAVFTDPFYALIATVFFTSACILFGIGIHAHLEARSARIGRGA